MMRLIARIVLALLSNALGVWVADLILDGMHVEYPVGFIVEVAIFTVITIIVQPLIIKMTLRQSAALAGSSALIATFVALLITVLISKMSIDGVGAWIGATIIIWLVSMLGGFLLPLFLFKKTMAAAKAGRAVTHDPSPAVRWPTPSRIEDWDLSAPAPALALDRGALQRWPDLRGRHPAGSDRRGRDRAVRRSSQGWLPRSSAGSARRRGPSTTRPPGTLAASGPIVEAERRRLELSSRGRVRGARRHLRGKGLSSRPGPAGGDRTVGQGRVGGPVGRRVRDSGRRATGVSRWRSGVSSGSPSWPGRCCRCCCC